MDYPISVPGIGLVGGRFVDENPVTGQVGSIISSAWANAVMDELLAILAHAGITPDEDTLDQVQQAIWKPASEAFAGVAALATAAEGQAGVDTAKIITAAVLKAVLDARPAGVPSATFAEVDALVADQGPFIVTDMPGNSLYTWVNTAYFTGYRSGRCGEMPDEFVVTPRPWELLMTGGVWNINDPKHKRVIAHFREQGLVCLPGDWIKGQGKIADIGGGDWKAPDAQDMFMRKAGTDADTANARPVGAHQADALQNITGSTSAFGQAAGSGGNGIGALGSSTGGTAAAAAGTGAYTPRTITFDASLVARTSSETRGASSAVAPVILI